MNLFQYSRGHFFGTVLPGAFFLICLLLIRPSLIQYLNYSSVFDNGGHDLLLITTCFIISYVIGVGLRLLNPDWLEPIALIFRTPVFGVQFLFKLVLKNAVRKDFIEVWEIYKQKFPYPGWFFSYHLPKACEKYQNFYAGILAKDFKNNQELLEKYYINYCKTYIYDNSKGLSDELMYNEGLIRFLCGIIYSMLILLIILCFSSASLTQLFWIILLVFIFFLYRLRGIRIKEILCILDGYYFLKTKQSLNHKL